MVDPIITGAINTTSDIINTTLNSPLINDTINKTTEIINATNNANLPFPTWWLFAFIGIVAIVFIVALLMKGINIAIALALNSVIGFFALYAVQLFLLQNLVINIWSIAVVAILGLPGFILVLLLHGLGLFF